jgi:hypothetical protein
VHVSGLRLLILSNLQRLGFKSPVSAQWNKNNKTFPKNPKAIYYLSFLAGGLFRQDPHCSPDLFYRLIGEGVVIEMTIQKRPDSETVSQVFPEKKQMPLEGLYLGQRLAEISRKIGRALVITNFMMDRNGVIAKAGAQHDFHVPVEIKNSSDWRLFQELLAQADIVICGADYLRRVSALGSRAGDILSQFEPGKEFEKLGEWLPISSGVS